MMKRFSSSKLFAFAALALVGAAHAQSQVQGGPGGSVAPINLLANTGGFVSTLTITGASSATTQNIYTGKIDNNFDKGWKLAVVSANAGKFIRTGGGGAGRELLYTNVTFVPTGGTLGAGLTAPTGGHETQSVVPVGGALFTTRGATQGTLATATSASVAYAFSLQVGWSANTTLLAGTYADDITLTLNNDAL